MNEHYEYQITRVSNGWILVESVHEAPQELTILTLIGGATKLPERRQAIYVFINYSELIAVLNLKMMEAEMVV